MAKKTKTKFKLRNRLLVLAFAAGLIGCVVYGIWAWTFDLKDVETMIERSTVFDMDGRYYSRLQGENRVVVPLNKVSKHFVQALLAREDTRFYKHHGVDPIGIARAMARNAVHGLVREGASTITQQLARNSLPLGGRNLHRKILEAFVALRMENHFSKQQILENYINRIYFGSGFYGVETASLAYFGKHAADLNLSESAMLVGLIRSPNRFSPFRNLKGAYAQRDAVLNRMVDLKMITRDQADAALKSKVAVSSKRAPAIQENYAMAAVLSELDVLLSDDQVEEGGLKIYTTIDPQIQKAAAAAVETQLRKIEQRPGYGHTTRAQFNAQSHDENADTPYLQGSVVVIDNRTGGIRAIVGGRDYRESTYNRALLTKRQAGSTFKPFVYATAFAQGLSPDDSINDGPVRIGNWSPSNSDGTFRGPMAAQEGLIHSRNTMSVRVGEYAGVDKVCRTAAAVGLGKPPRNAAIFLGAFETTLKEMTSAFTVFPNNGVRKQPNIIERIDDQYGTVLYRAAHITAPALDGGVCSDINAILAQVLDRGTAATSRSLGWNKPAAGKTGTTNDYHDAWFVGYTKSLTCGVWVGLDQPQTIISKGYGAALALPIWIDVMNAAQTQKYPADEFDSRRRSIPVRRAEPSDQSVRENFLRSFRRFFGGH